MKRDFDLIRKILLVVEDHSSGQGMQLPELMERLPGYEPPAVVYNIDLIIKAGFVEGEVYSAQSFVAVIVGLTWQGHDFLDAARSDTIWKKTKDKLLEVGGSASLEIVKAVLTQFTKIQLGLS